MSTGPIQHIVVLGGGSAGFIAALTLKRRLPQLLVTVLRSPDIGVIGVGEGTTAAFPRHFFENLKLQPKQFYAEAQPTWKLGLKFLWGSRPEFYYAFAEEYQQRWPDLMRNTGFFVADQPSYTGAVSALMAHDKAFARGKDGRPHFHNLHAFHIENKKLVAWLENVSRELGVEVRDATVRAEVSGGSIAELIAENGDRITADLFVDASGFRSEHSGARLASHSSATRILCFAIGP
jgi:tryptophan halogenase